MEDVLSTGGIVLGGDRQVTPQDLTAMHLARLALDPRAAERTLGALIVQRTLLARPSRDVEAEVHGASRRHGH